MFVFFKTKYAPTPIPALNIPPPIKHNKALTIVALSGVIIGTIVKNNIPIPSDNKIESHNFCFAITLVSTNIETKIETKKIFDKMLITTLPAVTEPKSNGSPATAPPIIEPMKNIMSIKAPTTKLIAIFEIT